MYTFTIQHCGVVTVCPRCKDKYFKPLCHFSFVFQDSQMTKSTRLSHSFKYDCRIFILFLNVIQAVKHPQLNPFRVFQTSEGFFFFFSEAGGGEIKQKKDQRGGQEFCRTSQLRIFLWINEHYTHDSVPSLIPLNPDYCAICPAILLFSLDI